MKLKELYFVTSNRKKAQEAQEILGFPVKIFHAELDEIQEMDIKKIITKKAEAAYKTLKKPLIVDDVGMYVEAWNGFPGPFIKFLQEAGGMNELLLKWMSF